MNDELCRAASIVVATHDIQEEALYATGYAAGRRVVAFGPPQQVLNAETLLETFGIVIDKNQKRPTVLECTHGHDTEPAVQERQKPRRFWPF
jgi:manganese/iron transport system ATP-binding protein/manganese transport system ATP-binding protein/manganese/zinc/iron transport system ATP- binding protein